MGFDRARVAELYVQDPVCQERVGSGLPGRRAGADRRECGRWAAGEPGRRSGSGTLLGTPTRPARLAASPSGLARPGAGPSAGAPGQCLAVAARQPGAALGQAGRGRTGRVHGGRVSGGAGSPAARPADHHQGGAADGFGGGAVCRPVPGWGRGGGPAPYGTDRLLEPMDMIPPSHRVRGGLLH